MALETLATGLLGLSDDWEDTGFDSIQIRLQYTKPKHENTWSGEGYSKCGLFEPTTLVSAGSLLEV